MRSETRGLAAVATVALVLLHLALTSGTVFVLAQSTPCAETTLTTNGTYLFDNCETEWAVTVPRIDIASSVMKFSLTVRNQKFSGVRMKGDVEDSNILIENCNIQVHEDITAGSLVYILYTGSYFIRSSLTVRSSSIDCASREVIVVQLWYARTNYSSFEFVDTPIRAEGGSVSLIKYVGRESKNFQPEALSYADGLWVVLRRCNVSLVATGSATAFNVARVIAANVAPMFLIDTVNMFIEGRALAELVYLHMVRFTAGFNITVRGDLIGPATRSFEKFTNVQQAAEYGISPWSPYKDVYRPSFRSYTSNVLLTGATAALFRLSYIVGGADIRISAPNIVVEGVNVTIYNASAFTYFIRLLDALLDGLRLRVHNCAWRVTGHISVSALEISRTELTNRSLVVFTDIDFAAVAHGSVSTFMSMLHAKLTNSSQLVIANITSPMLLTGGYAARLFSVSRESIVTNNSGVVVSNFFHLAMIAESGDGRGYYRLFLFDKSSLTSGSFLMALNINSVVAHGYTCDSVYFAVPPSVIVNSSITLRNSSFDVSSCTKTNNVVRVLFPASLVGLQLRIEHSTFLLGSFAGVASVLDVSRTTVQHSTFDVNNCTVRIFSGFKASVFSFGASGHVDFTFLDNATFTMHDSPLLYVATAKSKASLIDFTRTAVTNGTKIVLANIREVILQARGHIFLFNCYSDCNFVNGVAIGIENIVHLRATTFAVRWYGMYLPHTVSTGGPSDSQKNHFFVRNVVAEAAALGEVHMIRSLEDAVLNGTVISFHNFEISIKQELLLLDYSWMPPYFKENNTFARPDPGPVPSGYATRPIDSFYVLHLTACVLNNFAFEVYDTKMDLEGVEIKSTAHCAVLMRSSAADTILLFTNLSLRTMSRVESAMFVVRDSKLTRAWVEVAHSNSIALVSLQSWTSDMLMFLYETRVRDSIFLFHESVFNVTSLADTHNHQSLVMCNEYEPRIVNSTIAFVDVHIDAPSLRGHTDLFLLHCAEVTQSTLGFFKSFESITERSSDADPAVGAQFHPNAKIVPKTPKKTGFVVVPRPDEVERLRQSKLDSTGLPGSSDIVNTVIVRSKSNSVFRVLSLTSNRSLYAVESSAILLRASESYSNVFDILRPSYGNTFSLRDSVSQLTCSLDAGVMRVSVLSTTSTDPIIGSLAADTSSPVSSYIPTRILIANSDVHAATTGQVDFVALFRLIEENATCSDTIIRAHNNVNANFSGKHAALVVINEAKRLRNVAIELSDVKLQITQESTCTVWADVTSTLPSIITFSAKSRFFIDARGSDAQAASTAAYEGTALDDLFSSRLESSSVTIRRVTFGLLLREERTYGECAVDAGFVSLFNTPYFNVTQQQQAHYPVVAVCLTRYCTAYAHRAELYKLGTTKEIRLFPLDDALYVADGAFRRGMDGAMNTSIDIAEMQVSVGVISPAADVQPLRRVAGHVLTVLQADFLNHSFVSVRDSLLGNDDDEDDIFSGF